MIQLPSQTVFFSIERAIREYRRFAQKNLQASHPNITIDQAQVLFYLHHQPELTQNQIANLIFRDAASLTRMIDSMEKKQYVKRSIHKSDRRKFKYRVTDQGQTILADLYGIIDHNRKIALKNISKADLANLERTLNSIVTNCAQNDVVLTVTNSAHEPY